MTTPAQRSFLVAYAIWSFGVFSYFVPGATWSPVSRFSTTRAIVERHTLTIDAFAASTGDRARAGGHWYSDKAPIPALLAVVPYFAYHAYNRARGRAPEFTALGTDDFPARRVYVNGAFQRGLYVCSLSTAGASGAILAVLLFEVLRRRWSQRTALLASAATVMATPILPYATSFYGHTMAAAFLFGAIATMATRDDQSGSPHAWSAPSRARLRTAGACLALAPGCEYIVAVPSAIIGAWIVVSAPRGARSSVIAHLAAGAALPVAAVSAYHWACFGAPWRTGYSYIQRPEFAAGHASGLLGIHPPTLRGLRGLLVGARRGLFYLAPVTILGSLAAVVHVLRNRDGAARVLVLAAVALLALNAGYYMWWGGAATGPRHWIPTLTFLAFGIASAWQNRWLRMVAVPLLVMSFANMMILTAVGLEVPERGDALTAYAYPLLARGMVAHISGASNLGIQLGLARAATLGPVLAWIVVGLRLLLRRLDAMEEPEPPEGLAGAQPAQ